MLLLLLFQVITVGNKPQKLMFDRLKAEFKDTVTRYNKLQKDVAQKVKSSIVLSRYVHEQSCLKFQHPRPVT